MSTVDLMGAVNRAQTAASHARPFMKLMDALVDLTEALKVAHQIQTDVDSAAARKTALENEIPGLQTRRDNLLHEIQVFNANRAKIFADHEAALLEKTKASDAEFAAKRAGELAAHEAVITELRAQIEQLNAQKELAEKVKAEIDAIIETQKQNFNKAAAALHS